MQWKMMGMIFFCVFMAELGDKTQLATMMFAADCELSRVWVFVASAAALVISSLLAVIVGAQLNRFISPQALKLIAGAAFVLIGGWIFWDAIKG